ncbi:MAG TPA: hypothetical protein VLU94_01220 [Candidatus Nitrosotalea sp.]|nr:hypothetical protein [Candidatus Nitrosotalea sp.]
MILILLRIVFGLGLAYGFYKARENALAAPETGDLTNAAYLAYCVALSIANAVVWAPYVGGKLSDPLTGAITRSTYVERKNHLLRLIQRLDARGFRRCALVLSFVEGVHRPDWPTAFFLGLKNAKPGSWLEKVFAFEVFRFDNFQHCMLAFQTLRRHGIDPRPHHNPEVNIILASLDRQVRPESEILPVPEAPPPPPLRRDRRIQLFDIAAEPARESEAKSEIVAQAPEATGQMMEPSSGSVEAGPPAGAAEVEPSQGADPATSR